MKHPAVIARADGLKTEEILTANIVGYTKGKGSNERGYMCKTCPQIHATLMALKIHCQEDHNQAEPAASEHATETETEEQPDRSPQGSASEAASLKNKTSAASTAETGLSQQQDSPERGQVSAQNTAALYMCHMCTYTGTHRKYLYCHYKKTHRLDAFSTFKLLEKYNKRKRKFRSLPAAASEERAHVKCKKCPDLTFGSSQLLIAHYSTFHSSDCKLDFTVLSQIREKSTGIYKCCHCRKQLNGIRNLCRHLDRHRAWRIEKKMAAETKASFVVTTTPETTPTEVCRQDEVPMLETVEELNQWSVRPAETFTLPTSPLSVHSKPTDLEQPELEPREEKHTCNQCRRKFMSLKGLRLHERSHAALAAIKKLPTSALKNNINQYVLYKAGTVRPFLCSFCSYRTTVLGLWRSHFMKKHQDVIKDPVETDNQDEENSERANKEPHHLSEEKNCFPESDEEPEMTETSLYLEPPDVQRQLNHYSLMAQTGVSSKGNLQETALPDNRLLHCEFCNFNTGHLSSVRRHYLNRHGKKILRCKDCDFFTGLRKTLEMHMESCHTTCQSEATHQKDLRCPFCLYQTKNKNNMIDHIVLHREERVVPIEVRRPKLSRYLQGIVFRCHKCTFTSGSAENLRLHMSRHNDIKPYKCRLCYFDCTLLSDLEAHLSDKHQVVRNHELVGQVSLDQLEARVGRRPEEEEEEGEEEHLSDLQHHNNGSEGLEKEHFVTDSNEVLHETRAENVALQIKEACEKPAQDPGPRTEDKTQQNAGKGNSADTHSGQCSDPEMGMQTKESQAQPKVRGGENSSTIFTQQKEEAAAGSSTTYGKIAEQTEALKLNIKAIQHRTMNSEARVEDDILRQILVLDKDGRRKADRTRAVKIEQSVETKEVDGTRSELPDDEGRIALARNPKNHMQANNIRIQESLKIGKHLLTLLPNCAKLKLKIRHKDNLRVSFTNCKEEQVRNQKTSQEATDPYGEMPVLENEYLKEETQLLTCCKEEEEGDHLEQQEEDKEAEAVTEDNEVRCKDQGNEEGGEIKEADGPRVHKSTFTTRSGTAEVLSPSVTEKKLHTCEFCGRNLMNSSELKRHVMRHGI